MSCLLVGYGLGTWLDGYFGTGQTFLAIMVLVGAAAGFFEVFQIIRKIQREQRRLDADPDRRNP